MATLDVYGETAENLAKGKTTGKEFLVTAKIKLKQLDFPAERDTYACFNVMEVDGVKIEDMHEQPMSVYPGSARNRLRHKSIAKRMQKVGMVDTMKGVTDE